MISTWIVQFKTGYELTDNERFRIRERMEEELSRLAARASACRVRLHFILRPLTVRDPR